MPAFIDNPEDNRLWKKAKGIAEKNGHKEDWPYITGIYKKMRGNKVGAVVSDFEVVQNLVGKTVSNVIIANFDGVADVTMSDGSMIFIHTPPPGVKAITSCMVNDTFTVLNVKGRQVEAVVPTSWDSHVVNVMFDNGSVVAVHTDVAVHPDDNSFHASVGDNTYDYDPRSPLWHYTRTSEEGVLTKLETGYKEKIPGGLAKGKKPEDFDADALAKGQDVEMEHTDDPNVAREISMDHLMEDQAYYDKLETIEKHAGQLADRYLRNAMTESNPEDKLAQRYLAKKAALVGTDSATIWSIDPIQLKVLISIPDWVEALEDMGKNYNYLIETFRENGGAVFETGADGNFDVKIPRQEPIKEMGFKAPYGTPGYTPKKAATINTETASVYVLAGEHLEKIIESGEFNSAISDKDYNRADKVILDAGGLVFHTGADGSYEVDVKPAK